MLALFARCLSGAPGGLSRTISWFIESDLALGAALGKCVIVGLPYAERFPHARFPQSVIRRPSLQRRNQGV
jgi:hypothetical protein